MSTPLTSPPHPPVELATPIEPRGETARAMAFLLLALLAWTLAIVASSGLLLAICEAFAIYAALAWLLPRHALSAMVSVREQPTAVVQGDLFVTTITLHNTCWLPLGRIELLVHQPGCSPARQRLALPGLAPHRRQQLCITARALTRGAYHPAAATLSASDPLGLFRAQRQLTEQARELLILPRPFEPAWLRRVAHGPLARGYRGEASSGSGAVQLHGLREADGTRQKRIHWRASARHGRLIAMETAGFGAPTLTVAIDCSVAAATHDRAAVERTISMAAAVFAHAEHVGASAVLLADDPAACPTPLTGREGYRQLQEALARLELQSQRAFHDVLAASSPVAGSQVILLHTATASSTWIRHLRQAWRRRGIELIDRV